MLARFTDVHFQCASKGHISQNIRWDKEELLEAAELTSDPASRLLGSWQNNSSEDRSWMKEGPGLPWC